jgi:AraC-like DNA-binding protein
MYTKQNEFNITSRHRIIQKALQKFVRVIYTRAYIDDPQIITQSIVDTLDCSSEELELCLGHDTGLTFSELRKEGLDIKRLKAMFCRHYPNELQYIHIEGAVKAELEMLNSDRTVSECA